MNNKHNNKEYIHVSIYQLSVTSFVSASEECSTEFPAKRFSKSRFFSLLFSIFAIISPAS